MKQRTIQNIKVTSYGISTIGANFGPAYFIVEYPDGSRAQYGNSIDSSTVTDYAINFWQNPQGIKIVYNYIKNQNSIEIAFIKYGSPANAGALINEIEFVYKTRQRPEKLYVGGYLIEKNILLSQINVRGNNIGFRNYLLEHNSTS